jgi:DNA-binding MarR family transcriptional regulator
VVSEEAVERFSRLLPRLGKVYAGFESSFKDTSLTKLDLLALGVLGKREHFIMSELTEKLSVALSSATGIIDRLVEKGYVSRSRTDKDRRIVQVRLTEKGANLLADKNMRAMLMVERMLSCLDEQEQEELIHLLEKVAGTLSES